MGREPQTPDNPLGPVCGVCLCGKGQGSAGSLKSEGPGIPSKKFELCPESRRECQAQARKEEAPPHISVPQSVEEGTGGHL